MPPTALQDMVTAPLTGGVAQIATLNPVTYQWIAGKQGTETIVPYEGFLSSDSTSLIPSIDATAYLCAAIQEMSATLTALQTQVTTLQASVTQLSG
jgi:hypothetical protein